MLTPDYLDTLPDALVALWQQVEDDILRDIGRRIAKMDGLTETAAWQLYRYEQTQALHLDIAKLLARYSGKSDAELRRILQAAGRETLASDDEFYQALGFSPGDINTNPALLNLLQAGYRQTAGTWQNLTATTANTVTGAFERALDRAWLQVSSGAFDYQTAIRRAIDGLAKGGLPAVRYPSGHTDTLEVAVRRAVLTGVNQTAGRLQLARMDEFGWEFVEVTAHAGARPEHAVWQGKRFHRGGAVLYHGTVYEDFETATGYGTGPGLCGWNCRHNFYPCDPDTPPVYTEEALAALNAREVEYNGQMYTRYEVSQMQRSLERKVRDAKRQYLAEDAAGLDTARSAAQLKQARQNLNGFIRDTGGRLDSARTSVQGFGRSAAGKAAWAARRNQFTSPKNHGMMVPSQQTGGNPDVNFVCRLDKSIYQVVTDDLISSEVIITDVQLQHIQLRHPNISESVKSYLSEAILQPDYIIETDKPYTANILKRFTIDGKGYQLILRLKTSTDPEEYKNSIITFMSVNEKRWNQYLRNRRILYKRE